MISRARFRRRITFRRAATGLLACWLATAILKLPAAAAPVEFPDRSVRLVVGSAAGSAVDIIARLFAQHLSELWKHPVVVDNRSGANGQIAAGVVARSEPDGYTLMISTAATLTTNPLLYPDTGSFVVDDLEPVTVLVSNDFVVAARQSLNVRTFGEFLALARANPGKLNVATSVPGGAANLAAELFKQRSMLEYTVVPFNGGGAAINSLLGGHTDAIFESLTLTEPLSEAGKLVHLATTGQVRSSFTPTIPTVSEAGYPGFEVSGWLGLVAPKGTSLELRQKIRSDILRVARRDNLVERMSKVKMNVVVNTPEEFRERWTREITTWRNFLAKKGTNVDR